MENKFCYLCAKYNKRVKNNLYTCQFALNRGNVICEDFEYHNKSYKDELDEHLATHHNIFSGSCSGIESIKYLVARDVAKKLIELYGLPIQYNI